MIELSRIETEVEDGIVVPNTYGSREACWSRLRRAAFQTSLPGEERLTSGRGISPKLGRPARQSGGPPPFWSTSKHTYRRRSLSRLSSPGVSRSTLRIGTSSYPEVVFPPGITTKSVSNSAPLDR